MTDYSILGRIKNGKVLRPDALGHKLYNQALEDLKFAKLRLANIRATSGPEYHLTPYENSEGPNYGAYRAQAEKDVVKTEEKLNEITSFWDEEGLKTYDPKEVELAEDLYRREGFRELPFIHYIADKIESMEIREAAERLKANQYNDEPTLGSDGQLTGSPMSVGTYEFGRTITDTPLTGKQRRQKDEQVLENAFTQAVYDARPRSFAAQLFNAIHDMVRFGIEFKTVGAVVGKVAPGLAATTQDSILKQIGVFSGQLGLRTLFNPLAVMQRKEVYSAPYVSMTSDGELVFELSQSSPATDWLKGYLHVLGSTGSEMAGDYLTKWTMPLIKKLPFGKHLVKHLQRIGDEAADLTTPRFWSGTYGEWLEERLETALQLVLKTEDFGADPDADFWGRLEAAMTSDLKQQPVEIMTLMIFSGGKKFLQEAYQSAKTIPRKFWDERGSLDFSKPTSKPPNPATMKEIPEFDDLGQAFFGGWGTHAAKWWARSATQEQIKELKQRSNDHKQRFESLKEKIEAAKTSAEKEQLLPQLTREGHQWQFDNEALAEYEKRKTTADERKKKIFLQSKTPTLKGLKVTPEEQKAAEVSEKKMSPSSVITRIKNFEVSDIPSENELELEHLRESFDLEGSAQEVLSKHSLTDLYLLYTKLRNLRGRVKIGDKIKSELDKRQFEVEPEDLATVEKTMKSISSEEIIEKIKSFDLSGASLLRLDQGESLKGIFDLDRSPGEILQEVALSDLHLLYKKLQDLKKLGKLEQKLVRQQKQEEEDQVAGGIEYQVTRGRMLGRDIPKEFSRKQHWWQKLARKVWDVGAKNRALEAESHDTAYRVDKTEGGLFSQTVVQPILNADDKAYEVSERLTQTLAAVFNKAGSVNWFKTHKFGPHESTLVEVLKIYVNSKNKHNRTILNRTFTDTEIEQAIDTMSVGERVLGDNLVSWCEDVVYPLLDSAYTKIKSKHLNKDVGYWIVNDLDLTDSSIEMELHEPGSSGTGVSAARTKERVRHQKRFKTFNIFRDIDTLIRTVSNYVGKAETIRDVSKLLSRRDVQRSVEQSTNPYRYKALMNWIKDQANPESRYAENDLEKMVNFFGNNMALANLVFNATSELKAPVSAINGLVELSNEYGYGNVTASLFEYLRHPIEIHKFIMQNSTMMRKRHGHFEQLGDIFYKSMKELLTNIKEPNTVPGKAALARLGRALWGIADSMGADPVWWAAYRGAQKTGKMQGKNINPSFLEEGAIKRADNAVDLTQTTGVKAREAGYRRIGGFTKEFFRFTSQLFKQRNQLSRLILQIKEDLRSGKKTKAFTRAASDLFLRQIPIAYAIGIFSRRRPPENWKEFGKDLLLNSFGSMFLVGNIMRGWEYGIESSLLPAVSSGVRKVLTGTATGDKTTIIKGAATLAGIPGTSQLSKVWEGRNLSEKVLGKKSPLSRQPTRQWGPRSELEKWLLEEDETDELKDWLFNKAQKDELEKWLLEEK